MSHSTSDLPPLDPARPWITDPEDLPSRINWLATLFNVMGRSSRLHFTRAWTLLFMLQFLFVFGGGLLLFILALTGVDTAGLSVAKQYASAAVFLVTGLMSFVIHNRRLADAGKSSAWAVLILLPLVIAGTVTLGNIQKSAAEYDVMYQKRAAFLEDPGAFREEALERRREAQKARADAREDDDAGGEAASRGPRRGGDRGGRRGFNAENEMPDQETFVLRPHVGAFVTLMMLLSAFLVPWSLMVVARAAPKGRDPQAAAG